MNLKDMYPHIGLGRWCGLFGHSRQAFYQQAWSQADKTMEEQMVISLVCSIREEQPRLGTRKLYVMLESMLNANAVKMGRDALFDLLAREGMLVKRRKRKFPRTTDPTGWFRRYEDLTVGLSPERTDQLWVSDITYIPLSDRFLYLSLLTDAYSHQIVGWSLREDLTTEGPLEALKVALTTRKPIPGLIHHSDRGTQYRSLEYVNLLKDYHARVSMTQSGDPRENAVAERVNGIVKNELLEGRTFSCHNDAKGLIEKVIKVYNTKRPHSSCQMLTPDKAAEMKGPLRKTWKTNNTVI